jgi:hypothetical protein
MATVLRCDEDDPASWPVVASHHPLRDAAAVDEDAPTVEPGTVWKRIEGFIGHRWPSRTVVYIVEGPGEFEPRLQPFTLSTVELWDDAAGWTATTAAPSALGYVLGEGRYRITGTAGDDSTPPEAVQEAYRRLHEYALGVARQWWAEAATYRTETGQAPAGWAGKAIHLSGAADLLRPWRRLGAY